MVDLEVLATRLGPFVVVIGVVGVIANHTLVGALSGQDSTDLLRDGLVSGLVQLCRLEGDLQTSAWLWSSSLVDLLLHLLLHLLLSWLSSGVQATSVGNGCSTLGLTFADTLGDLELYGRLGLVETALAVLATALLLVASIHSWRWLDIDRLLDVDRLLLVVFLGRSLLLELDEVVERHVDLLFVRHDDIHGHLSSVFWE